MSGPHQGRNVALFGLLCLIWGSTWLVIKVGYGGLGPFNVAALRFLLASAILAALTPLLGARWPRGASEWSLVAIVGVALFGGDYGLIYWAEQYLDSSLTAILFATLPVITALLAHFLVPGERITPRTLSGSLLAFAGVAALFGNRIGFDPAQVGPMVGVVLAAACAALAAVATKRHGAALHPATLNATAMLIGAVILASASIVAGDGFDVPRSASAWLAILYLAIFGSVVGFLSYFTLLKNWTVTSLSFVTIFTPVVALLLGVVFLNERVTIGMLAGAALIVAGVGLASTRGAGRSPISTSATKRDRRPKPTATV
jgi:drug/metabolite transporter (DMT)-like permease